MRCYIGVTPKEIEAFVGSNSLLENNFLSVSDELRNEDLEIDEEELEFEISLQAAQISRTKQGESNSRGYVIAMEVDPNRMISWSDVEAILVAETDEPELSWYAPQEVQTFLPVWLA